MSAETAIPEAPDAALASAVAKASGSPANVRRNALIDTSRPLGRAIRLLLVAGAFVVAFALKIPLCPVAIVTRQPCPGCGLTRATFALAQGHIHEAVHFHPLVFIVTPIVSVMFAYNAFSYVKSGVWFASEKLKGRFVNAAWLALGALMLGVWIARFFGAFGGPVPV